MISQLLIIAFVLICTITITYSYSIEIKPGSIECFYITATIGSPITGSYEVIHPDPKYISILVSDHNNKIHYKKKVTTELDEENKEDASEGFFSFDAEINGDYKMCLANGHKDENDGVSRLIAFNFRAASIGQQDYQFVGLQSELADLKEGLDLLKGKIENLIILY